MIGALDAYAKAIFEDIRDRPYRVCESAIDTNVWNCYTKGIELIQKLSVLGYGMRGRICGINWADLGIPDDILALYNPEMPDTHFYPEIYRNGAWNVLDPSWDKGAAAFGMLVSTWEGPNEPCFRVTHVYTPEEHQQCLTFWDNPDNKRQYFEKAAPFLKAVNAWLLTKRSST